MATIGFPIAFAIAPSDFGVAFHRLGVPEKFAFGIDLTFRFLPVAGRRLPDDRRRPAHPRLRLVGRRDRLPGPRQAFHAGDRPDRRQRHRRRRGHDRRDGPARVRDRHDGSWLRHLVYDRTDLLVIAFFAALLVAATLGGFLGTTDRAVDAAVPHRPGEPLVARTSRSG